MARSKVKMSTEEKNKCHAIIHTASIASGAAGAAPIPFSDAIPIGAAQIAMIVALGGVFDIAIGEATAKSIASVCLTTTAGRAIVTNALKIAGKFLPIVGDLLTSAIGGVTASLITEGIGWIVADDFFRVKNGERTINIPETIAKGIKANEEIKKRI